MLIGLSREYIKSMGALYDIVIDLTINLNKTPYRALASRHLIVGNVMALEGVEALVLSYTRFFVVQF